MHIAQLLPELDFGGVERGTVDLANELIDQSHQSSVVSAGGKLVAELRPSVTHFKLPIGQKSIHSLIQYKNLRKIYNENQFDIVHVRSRFPAWIHHISLRKQLNKPITVSTFHGLYSKPWYSKSMAYSDAIISISNTVTDYITSNYDVRDKEIIRIYRGCNTSKFNSTHIGESWLKQWNIDNPEMINKKILLMPARITHWKGIEFFLELIKHLNNNDIFGLVIGKVAANKNRYLQTLKNSAKRLGLNDQNIKFLDARPDIENLYKLSALVFNLSNKPEPFGRTIIEAAACGTSVIGWDRGGVSESLKKLNSSGAVKFGDMNELIGTTKRLLDSPDIINLPKEFTKDFQTSATIEFYKSLLSNSS